MNFERKKKKKPHVLYRMNILFLGVFLLFSVLILRLGVVQIVHGDDYKREVERTEDVAVSYSVPRGKLFDRNGNVIVDNNPKNAITYTNYGTSQKEMLEVAERLSLLIDVKPDKLQLRDKKDFWLLMYPEKGDKKVPKKERDKIKEEFEGNLKKYDREIYRLKLERITEEDLAELTQQDLEIAAIYSTFNSGYALTPQIVKNDGVTNEEFAAVSENLEYLPGVDTTTDWERVYTYENTLRSILGRVTTTTQGLPRENLDYFLSRGYGMNDRVGISHIEAQYEDVLSGQKARVKNITDKAGNILESKVITEGQRGKDLVLTIDMDLQIAVEKIIEEELRATKASGGTAYLDRAFVVLMDPFTGEILAMAGKRISRDSETGKMQILDHALGNIQEAYIPGSVVKGATILTGFKEGVIDRNTYFLDRPIRIGKGEPKSSWKQGLGTLNPVGALKVSSNVYMMEIAIRIGKGNYRPEQPLSLERASWDVFRDNFAQFGLGVQTGIDLPNEATGYKGNPKSSEHAGLLLDYSFGQYDTYSPMQLVQYVSTIANGGYRLKPRLVKEFREPLLENGELGPVFEEIKPTILNKLDLEKEWIDTVQEGFRQVMQVSGGTGVGTFGKKSYMPAGKTGTAQASVGGVNVNNLSLVAYAPYDNPEVAMAVVVPAAYTSGGGNSINMKIGERVLDTYFQLKADRETGKLNENHIHTNEEASDSEANAENADAETVDGDAVTAEANASESGTNDTSDTTNNGNEGTATPEGRTEEE